MTSPTQGPSHTYICRGWGQGQRQEHHRGPAPAFQEGQLGATRSPFLGFRVLGPSPVPPYPPSPASGDGGKAGRPGRLSQVLPSSHRGEDCEPLPAHTKTKGLAAADSLFSHWHSSLHVGKPQPLCCLGMGGTSAGAAGITTNRAEPSAADQAEPHALRLPKPSRG